MKREGTFRLEEVAALRKLLNEAVGGGGIVTGRPTLRKQMVRQLWISQKYAIGGKT